MVTSSAHAQIVVLLPSMLLSCCLGEAGILQGVFEQDEPREDNNNIYAFSLETPAWKLQCVETFLVFASCMDCESRKRVLQIQ